MPGVPPMLGLEFATSTLPPLYEEIQDQQMKNRGTRGRTGKVRLREITWCKWPSNTQPFDVSTRPACLTKLPSHSVLSHFQGCHTLVTKRLVISLEALASP